MMEVFVNGESVVVPKTFTVLQACDAAGVDIPRLATFRAHQLRDDVSSALIMGCHLL
jgi:hypothetical protein